MTHVSLCRGVITHTLSLGGTCRPALAPGEEVTGEIDDTVRRRNMQVHTGEHILSGTLYRLYGFANVGFHLGADEVTADFDGTLTPAQWDEVEETVNRIIRENHPVKAYYPTEEQRLATSYRAKREVEGPLRLVQIGENGCVDVCACCAPHVAHTGEVGLVKIVNPMHYKGGTRLWICAGPDALKDYRARYAQDVAVSTRWSIKQNEIEASIAKLQDRIFALSGAVSRMQTILCDAALAGARVEDGIVTMFLDGVEPARLRECANRALDGRLAGASVCLLFSKRGDEPVTDYLCMTTNGSLNLRTFAPVLNGALGGRGGGSPTMIQGSVSADEDAIRAFLAAAPLQI